MGTPVKQHLIDPEICIRCHACEEACPIGAISHNDDNVVVNFDTCNHGMDCVGPCPTGAIDNWLVVTAPFSIDEQFEWMELPPEAEVSVSDKADLELEIEALLEKAHSGAGGKAVAPASAATPHLNIHGFSSPLKARVQGNFRLTEEDSDADVRHVIIDIEGQNFPVLEGQTIGVIAPGKDTDGKAHIPRLYSVSSPRDGERPGSHNIALTVKREDGGLCSNHICDLVRDDEILITGPYGSTFLAPEDPNAHLLMICTGTGSAPFRAFTMHRQRTMPDAMNKLSLFFGARTPRSLPYFGPLEKVPDEFMAKYFCYSRLEDQPRQYVQDRMLAEKDALAMLLKSPDTCIYVCGLKAMEQGVDAAFSEVAASAGLDWTELSSLMRGEGRYHVETY